MLQRLPRRLRSTVAHEYRTHVWVTVQLSTTAGTRGTTASFDSYDFAECRSIAFAADNAILLSPPDRKCVPPLCSATATKTRSRKPSDPVVLSMDIGNGVIRWERYVFINEERVGNTTEDLLRV